MERIKRRDEFIGGNNSFSKSKFTIASSSTDSIDLIEKKVVKKVVKKNEKMSKLELFSKKYSLHKFIKSSVMCKKDNVQHRTVHTLTTSDPLFDSNFQGIVINSVFIVDNMNSINDKVSYCEKSSLIEHSILSGEFCVGCRSVVSHVPGFLGVNLIVLDNMMMQYVPVKYGTGTGTLECEEFVVLLFSIDDDIKEHYSSERSSICGASWDSLFNVRT